MSKKDTMDETKHNETATQSVEMTAEELEAYQAFRIVKYVEAICKENEI